MKQQKTAKTWQRTRHQNLIRHKSGKYYGRAYSNGKEIWQSLKTSHLSVAQAKLAEFLKDHRERVSNGSGETSAKMTSGEAAAIDLRNVEDNLSLNRGRATIGENGFPRLKKAGRACTKPKSVRSGRPTAKNGRRPIAKLYRRPAITTPVSILRHVLNVAVEAGVVYRNAAGAVKRAPVRGNEIALPTIQKFNALIGEMRAGHSRDSVNCADFALGLAVTGMRRRGEYASMARCGFPSWRNRCAPRCNNRHEELGIAPRAPHSRGSLSV